MTESQHINSFLERLAPKPGNNMLCGVVGALPSPEAPADCREALEALRRDVLAEFGAMSEYAIRLWTVQNARKHIAALFDAVLVKLPDGSTCGGKSVVNTCPPRYPPNKSVGYSGSNITVSVPADTVARTISALQAAMDWFDGEGRRKSSLEVRDLAAEAQMLLVGAIQKKEGSRG